MLRLWPGRGGRAISSATDRQRRLPSTGAVRQYVGQRGTMSAMRELNRSYRWVLVVPLLLLASIACGGSDPENTPAPSGPSVEHPPEVQEAIDELEGNAGFRPLLQTYLPDGVNPTPETAHVRDESQQTAIIAYFP